MVIAAAADETSVAMSVNWKSSRLVTTKAVRLEPVPTMKKDRLPGPWKDLCNGRLRSFGVSAARACAVSGASRAASAFSSDTLACALYNRLPPALASAGIHDSAWVSWHSSQVHTYLLTFVGRSAFFGSSFLQGPAAKNTSDSSHRVLAAWPVCLSAAKCIQAYSTYKCSMSLIASSWNGKPHHPAGSGSPFGQMSHIRPCCRIAPACAPACAPIPQK